MVLPIFSAAVFLFFFCINLLIIFFSSLSVLAQEYLLSYNVDNTFDTLNRKVRKQDFYKTFISEEGTYNNVEKNEKQLNQEQIKKDKSCKKELTFEEENGVLILDKTNFNAAVQKFNFLLVQFNAVWCGQCKQIAEGYATAAKILRNYTTPIYFAKVDYEKNEDLAKRLAIGGLPTLKFFVDGKPEDYTGRLSKDRIVQWMQKRVSFVPKNMQSVEDLELFLAKSSVAVIGFFQPSYELREFFSASKFVDEVLFAYTYNKTAFRKFNVTKDNAIIMLKNFNEGKVLYDGDVNDEVNIYKFVVNNRLPLVTIFSEDTASELFTVGLPVLIIIRHLDVAGMQAEKALYEAANSLKGKVLMTISNSQSNIEMRLMQYLGLKDEDIPAVRLLKNPSDSFLKFAFNGQITRNSLIKFADDVINNKTLPYIKSEPILQYQKGPVYIVVGKNFNDVVINSKKDVLVVFYAHWCIHCKVLEPVYNLIAEKMSNEDNIIIAKIDAMANDIKDVNITGYPTILFYPSYNKTHPIDYNGERTFESIIDFLHKHATTPFSKDEL